MSNKNFGLDLTEGRVGTLLLRFAAPFLLANLVSSLYGIADMIIVGQFTNSAIMSGVATGTQVTNLSLSFMMGIGTGGTVLIGRFVGARNNEGAAKATGSLLIIAAVVILLLTSVLWFFRDALLAALKTPPEALDSARRFVKICTIGVPFHVGYSMLSAISRGMGNSKAPGIVAAVSCVINIVLAYVLVGVFHMAESGAAIATSSAQFVSFTSIAVWLIRRKLPFKFSPRDIRPDGAASGQILTVGLPIVLQELLITISFMIIMARVNFLSVDASAAVGVVARAFNIAVIVPLGMGSAISATTAQNIGAGKPARAIATMRWGIFYSLLPALALFAYCQISPESVTAIFTNDPVVIEGAANYLKSFFIDALLVAFVFCMNAYLCGCGRSSISMIHSLASTFLIRVPLSILFTGTQETALNETLRNLGYAAPIATFFSLIFCIIYIARFSRRLSSRTVTEAGL